MWESFKARCKLDDPTVPVARTGYGRAYLDLGNEAARLSVYAARSTNEVGAFMRFRGDAGRELFAELATQRATLDAELAGALPEARMNWTESPDFSTILAAWKRPGPWHTEAEEANLDWLLRAANLFANVFGPLVRNGIGD
jgi:hypothetical protein